MLKTYENVNVALACQNDATAAELEDSLIKSGCTVTRHESFNSGDALECDALIISDSLIQEFISSLEEQKQGQQLRSVSYPVIALIESNDQECISNAIKMGATDFISPGLADEVLQLRLSNALKIADKSPQTTEYCTNGKRILCREHIAVLSKIEAQRETLKIAQAEAKQAAIAKQEFLANISHEIRTPLTAIIGYSELLTDNDLLAEERLNAARTVISQALGLQSILHDILELAQLESSKYLIKSNDISLQSMLNDLQNSLQPQAEKKGLEFIIRCSSDLPETLVGDSGRIRQALTKMIENSIKYTHEGEIEVTVTGTEIDAQNYHVEIAVRDTGIGIPEKMLDFIFDPFTQADASYSRRYGGSGLGLAIAQRTAAILGGRLDVHSEIDVGSTFILQLDLSNGKTATNQTPHTRIPQEEKVISDDPVVDQPEDYRPRVLVVDDCDDSLRLFKFFLSKIDADVCTCSNGHEAVVFLTENRADVVVMDMAMPVLNGYEATHILRARGETMPIIAATAHAMIGDREKCLECGCNEYITKPINREQFLNLINSYLLASKEESPTVC